MSTDFEASSDPPIDRQSDAQLWSQLQRGETEALGILYDRHATLVYGIALKMLRQPQDAEDLVQEIFVKLAQSAYSPDRGSLRTFLSVLTRSRSIDRLRANQRHQASLREIQTNQASLALDLPESAYKEELSESVQLALAQLSENQRRVLELAYKEGLSQAAIAKKLNTPLGTVKAWARRGLISLRQHLQRALEDEL